MSIEGGMHRAVDRAESVAATALQVFVKSARQWAPKPLDAAEIDRFRERTAEQELARHTLAHSSYLINLASPERALRERSRRALADEVGRCEKLGIPYLVLHPGSHVGSGEGPGLRRVAEVLDRVLDDDGGVEVLLETTAGQGTNLGHRFEQLAEVLERAENRARLGVCFDTCHALAAGYEFRDAASASDLFRRFDGVIGLDRLKAFHLNDSKFGIGTRKDRHEHIGHGEVGLEAFRLILNDPRFRDLPMVLETPKGDDLSEDRENLGVLRAMIPGARR
jgi:deoxyribonuclease-4